MDRLPAGSDSSPSGLHPAHASDHFRPAEWIGHGRRTLPAWIMMVGLVFWVRYPIMIFWL